MLFIRYVIIIVVLVVVVVVVIVVFPPASGSRCLRNRHIITKRMRKWSVFKRVKPTAAVESDGPSYLLYLSALSSFKNYSNGFGHWNIRTRICWDTVLSRMVSLWPNRS